MVLVLLFMTAALATPHPAERTIYADTNHARVVRNIPPLAWGATLHKLARAWAVHLAFFHHLMDPEKVYCGYQGTNVGVSETPLAMFRAWMASPAHRVNILNPKFARIGVGTTRDTTHALWAVQIFCGGA
jgi:uncharacterized protein YkwD